MFLHQHICLKLVSVYIRALTVVAWFFSRHVHVCMYVCVVCTSLHLFVSFACAIDCFMDVVLYMIEYTMKV